MAKPSTKQMRTLKTRIDIQEAAYEIVFSALDTIVTTGVNRSESAALRRLIFLGAHAFFGAQASQGLEVSEKELANRLVFRTPSPRVEPTLPMTASVPASADGKDIKTEPRRRDHTPHSSQFVTTDRETDQPGSNQLSRLKSMAISQSVVQVETTPKTRT